MAFLSEDSAPYGYIFVTSSKHFSARWWKKNSHGVEESHSNVCPASLVMLSQRRSILSIQIIVCDQTKRQAVV